MKKTTLALCVVLMMCAATAQEKYEIWPGLAPGETVREPNVELRPGQTTPSAAFRVTTPQILVYQPEKKTSDACVMIFPGGGYDVCYYYNEAIPNAQWWNEHGYTAIVLVYRVPRPVGKPIYLPAWQDAQRAIRFVRANAEKFGINPDKIGVQGYSAGAHLTLLAAVNSQTRSYEPIDALDEVSCHVSFAMPVYPAYVLEDGATGPNSAKGNDSTMLPDLHFDDKTPPMCLLHGDNDIYSPMGSVQIYHQLRKMNIPCELHIFAGAPHGFMFWNEAPNTQSWKDREYAWLRKMGF